MNVLSPVVHCNNSKALSDFGLRSVVTKVAIIGYRLPCIKSKRRWSLTERSVYSAAGDTTLAVDTLVMLAFLRMQTLIRPNYTKPGLQAEKKTELTINIKCI